MTEAQPIAAPPAQFLTDASLDFLARRLRLLGFDVVTHRGARLEELFELAAGNGRTVLTTSARHPRRFAGVPCRRVDRGDPAAALRAIAADSVPASGPFSRCTLCNHALQRRTAFEASGEVPGRVLRAGGQLAYCPSCGKWYWPGTHVTRLRTWLEVALGAPLAGDEP